MSTRKCFIENDSNDDDTWLSSYGMMNDNILDELDGFTDANAKSNAVNVTVNLNSPVLEIGKTADLEHSLSVTVNINCILLQNNANVRELKQSERNDSEPRKTEAEFMESILQQKAKQPCYKDTTDMNKLRKF